MKKILTLFLLYISGFSAIAQNKSNNVCIGVVCPDSYENFSASGLSRLSQKMVQVATQNGVAAFNDGTFAMYPTLAVYDIQVVEGGMRNITRVKIDMTINVIQLGTRTVIGSIPVNLSGSGYSITEATTNAISNINVREKSYADFLSSCKQRIFDYDEQNSSNFIIKAKTLASQHQYEAALAQLAMYPECLPSYPKVSEATIAIFKEYQKAMSAQRITEAKAAIAIRDFEGAAVILSEIDPESPSYKECLTLIETVKKNVSKDRQDEINREQKRYDSQVELEKYRINAAKEIAKAYYSNQPTITYTQIVK